MSVLGVNYTMKYITILTFTILSLNIFGNTKPGFDKEELKYTIAMCNSYNYTKQFGTDKEIAPKGFKLQFESDIKSMDNKFQIYQNGKIGVINFRGSTQKIISWVENCYSAMIPGKDKIVINDKTIKYTFCKNDNAGVHAGYALTIIILSETIIEQIKILNKEGIYNIITTGHSQGGALATLTRAFLEHVPRSKLSSKNSFKTYTYASPMCGNKEFREEYNELYSEKGTSYSIINPKDMVPYLPFNFDEEKLVSKKRVIGWLSGKEKLNVKKICIDAFLKTFERTISVYVKGTNSLLDKLLYFNTGKIEMPEFMSDINYYPVGDQKNLQPFDYPKIVVDTTGFEPVDFKKLEQGEDGQWCKKEPSFFQHKPYNYYVYVLKQWDNKAYRKLDKKYLKSDI